MKNEKVKKMIPLYLDGQLQPFEMEEVKRYLSTDEGQRELKAYEQSWEMLNEWEDIEPTNGYISRFWTQVSQERPWYERVLETLNGAMKNKRLAPSFVATCLVILLGTFAIQNYFTIQDENQKVVTLTAEEMEIVENLDLIEDYELIEDMDFFVDLEFIEDLDFWELSKA